MFEFEIKLTSFDGGRDPIPKKGSFFASIGLNPWIQKGRMISKYRFINSAKSSTLSNLAAIAAFVIISSTKKFGFNAGDGKIFIESSGTWSEHRTNANGGAKDAFLAPDSATPANLNMYYVTDTSVGKAVPNYATGDFTDSWKTGLTTAVPHKAAVVRDWALITNGRYLAGWKFSTGTAEVFQTNILDFQVGYESFKIAANKVGGIRQVYIAARYAADRSRDGIFVWDLNATAPVDFIPIPWLSDIYVTGGRLFAIYGNELNISYVTESGPSEELQKQILDSVVISAETSGAQAAATFLGRYGPFILISATGRRDVNQNGDSFYPGVWAYHIASRALFYWLPPSSNDLTYINATAMMSLNDNDLTVAFTVGDTSGGPRYYIDNLGTFFGIGSRFYSMLKLPTLGEDDKNVKEWLTLEFNHNILDAFLTSFRVELWVKDFRRRPTNLPHVGAIASVGNSNFVVANGNDNLVGVQVGDMVHVLTNTGAGQRRMISAIEVGATNTTYTIDRAWSTNPSTGSLIEWDTYKLVDILTSEHEDNDYKELMIGIKSAKMRAMIVMEFVTSSNSAISDGIEIRNPTIKGRTI